jgi:hypothetical protein
LQRGANKFLPSDANYVKHQPADGGIITVMAEVTHDVTLI